MCGNCNLGDKNILLTLIGLWNNAGRTICSKSSLHVTPNLLLCFSTFTLGNTKLPVLLFYYCLMHSSRFLGIERQCISYILNQYFLDAIHVLVCRWRSGYSLFKFARTYQFGPLQSVQMMRVSIVSLSRNVFMRIKMSIPFSTPTKDVLE